MLKRKTILKLLTGLVAGAVFGFLLGDHLSQTGGSCPLTCNPQIAAFYWGAVGLLVGWLV